MQNSQAPQNRLSNRLVSPLKNSLHHKNRVDVFNVNLPSTSQFRASLGGIAKKANVDLVLSNRNGTIVATSRNRGRVAESITVDQLEAGRYQLKAILKQGSQTNYKLRFGSNPVNRVVDSITLSDSVQSNSTQFGSTSSFNSPTTSTPLPTVDLGGNSIATATDRGKIGAGLTSVKDAVGAGDDADWYSFTVGEAGISSSRLKLALTSDAGVSARLYGAADLSDTLGSLVSDKGSYNPYANADLALGAGTYFVKVTSIGGGAANYNLDLSATGIADAAGNTKATAKVINNMQPFNGGKSFTTTDFVGHGDIDDYYTFTTTTKTNLTIQFDRLNTGNFDKARILHQLDRVGGNPISGAYWKNAQGVSISSGINALASSSYQLSGELEPGTYTLDLKSYFHNGDNQYRMTISTTP